MNFLYLHLWTKCLSNKITKAGKTTTAKVKLTKTKKQAKYPKAAIGMIFENPVAKNANAVVNEVVKIALVALLQV